MHPYTFTYLHIEKREKGSNRGISLERLRAHAYNILKHRVTISTISTLYYNHSACQLVDDDDDNLCGGLE